MSNVEELNLIKSATVVGDPEPLGTIYFEVLEGGKMPTKGENPGDIGLDFYSREEVVIPGVFYGSVTPNYDGPVELEEVDKKVLNRRLVPLGVKYQPDMPPGFLHLLPRSGLATKGLDVGAGVVDDGYRNEIRAAVINTYPFPIRIPAGTKIVQGVWQQALVPGKIEQVESVNATQRGEKGFGSSGLH